LSVHDGRMHIERARTVADCSGNRRLLGGGSKVAVGYEEGFDSRVAIESGPLLDGTDARSDRALRQCEI
jgi:hypothetical protein